MSWGHTHTLGVGVLLGLSLAQHVLLIAATSIAFGLILGAFGSRLYRALIRAGAIVARRLS